MSCLLHDGKGHVQTAYPDERVNGLLCALDACPQHYLCMHVEDEEDGPDDGTLCGQAWVRVDKPNRGIAGVSEHGEYPMTHKDFRWLVCAAGHRKSVSLEEYMTSQTLTARATAEMALGKAVKPEALDALFEQAPDIAEIQVQHDQIAVVTWKSEAANQRLIRPCTYVRIFTEGKVAVPFVEGRAICHTNDTYDRRLGILIAFNRAVSKIS